jgi:hypothetical protein
MVVSFIGGETLFSVLLVEELYIIYYFRHKTKSLHIWDKLDVW